MTTGVRRAAGVVLVLAAALLEGVSGAHAAGTLAAIRARGHVVCGVGNGPAGYATVSKQGVWSGIGVDFCAALAAAVLGSKEAVVFQRVAGAAPVAALRTRQVDVLARYPAAASGKDAPSGVRMAGILLHDGQGFMVRREQNITSALELSGARVCVARPGSAGYRAAGYFAGQKMPVELVELETWPDAVKTYMDKGCQVLSADVAQLAVARRGLGDPGAHVILPELAFKQPVGPAVRRGDDEWFSIVRWTLYALIAAEELGITAAGVEAAKGSADAEVRRFLGIDMDLGKRLGLGADWTQKVVGQVGNYGELFERHLGEKSPLGLERRQNNLSSKGGLHYAPSFR